MTILTIRIVANTANIHPLLDAVDDPLLNIDDRDLRNAAGTVLNADVLVTPSGKSKGCGVVEYSRSEYAERAIRTLNRVDFMGRPVFVREDREVEPKTPKDPRDAPEDQKLFVGNLSFSTSWQDLKDLFRKAGRVTHTDIDMDPETRRSKGSGLVIYDDPRDAAAAIEMFDGYEFRNRKLQVCEPPRATVVEHNDHRLRSSAPSSYENVPPPPAQLVPSSIGLVGGPDASLPSHGPNQIFVNNLPYSTTWEDLIDLFRHVGPVVRAEILMINGYPKGSGLVRFEEFGTCERAIGSDADAGAIEDPTQNKNLDSNIKKNTTFIKKCKASLAADSKQQLLNDIKKLSLEKYISEVVGGVLEGMLKCKSSADVAACVEVVSALHQRFPDTFTLLLSYNLAKLMQAPSRQHLASMSQEQREKEETARISKQRTYLRIIVELWLAGVLRNVSDGVPSLASTNLEGVENQGDGVAGFAGTSTSSSLKNRKKDGSKESERRSSGQDDFVYAVLKGLFADDMEQHYSLPLAASFLKNHGEAILGIVSRKQRAATQQKEGQESEGQGEVVTAGGSTEGNTYVTNEQRSAIKDLIVEYYRSVGKHLIKEHKYVRKIEHRNREMLFARGELSDEVKQNYEKLSKAYEKLLNNTQVLADNLDLEMPELPEEANVTHVSIVSAGASHAFADTKEPLANGIWEDEDARKFYEDLPDLEVLVPGIFLETPASKRTEQAEGGDTEAEENEVEKASQNGNEEPVSEIEDGNDDEDNESTDLVEKALESVDNDDDAEASTKPSQLAQLETLIARLPSLGNRDLIDAFAVEFCYVNSKASRKRLVKALLNVPRQRVDLLPYYSRLIATLGRYFPDVNETILAALDHEFKGLQRKKTQDLLESRVKNIRFLSELTKFKVTPAHTIFHVLKVALDDFTQQNIDIVCNLLEVCGRFLLKSPETAVRMGNMLDIMMRKKNVQHLDNRQALMVENAYYQANPPDRTVAVEKKRSPMELYIRKLLYGDLTKKSLDKTLRQLRKLHWEDPAIFKLILKIFRKIWKIKYSNIHLIAILACGLNRYHSDFGVQLVDSIVEEIRVGLEQNIFKHNQRRIAVVKYLGELYNYRMIDSPLIFDTLYTIVTLGHDYGRPARERFCGIDAPNDFFRIRLCCTMLDTCGMCFDRGKSKKKLDDFLAFFQMYIFTKVKPPMDIDFMVSDTFEMLRPQMQIFTSYEEANAAFDKILLEQIVMASGPDGKAYEDGFEVSDASESTSDEADDDEIDDNENEGEELDEGNVDSDFNANEEDNVVVHQDRPVISQQDEAAFAAELSQMITESMESRKYEKKSAVLDVPIPMNLRGTQDRRTASAQEKDTPESKMAFTLLTKKGNRQQARTMEVPSDSLLAINMATKQAAEREEQRQLKKLVLDYEERELAASRQAAEETRAKQRSTARGKRVLYMGGGGGGSAYMNPR
ncbi:hypothetical protein BX666DRAFT_2032401 [Dichotomocladium elegans]|nr:hypothetical protein BX666DRAFT_2032401 [Dichotomocladium elegans]